MEEFKSEVPEPGKPYTKYEGEVLYSGAPSTPESTDPLSNDLGHEDKGSLRIDREPTAKSPESKHSIFDVLRKKKVSIPIIGTVAAAAVLAAGISRLNSNDSSHQGNQPVATASVTPGSTAAPSAEASPAETLPTVPTVESLEISAEKSTPEEIAKNIVEHIDALTTACMTPVIYEQWYKGLENGTNGVQAEEWANNYIAPYTDAYFTALCGPDYKSNPDLTYFVSQFTAMAVDHIQNYMQTMTNDTPQTGKGAGGLPVYQYSSTFEKLVSAENGTYEIKTHEADNFTETNLVNVYPEIQSSSNVHGAFICQTKVVNDPNGNKIVRIVGLSYETSTSNLE